MFKLFNLVILFIIFFGVSALFANGADLSVINQEFRKIDNNQDGFVTSDEMQSYQVQTFQALDKNQSQDIDSEELEADQTDMHKLADNDQDGKVTFSESGSQFNKYFQAMDKNQDGKVSEAEYTDYWKLIYKF